MKKIIIITSINPLDRHGHSGVVYSICSELRKSYQLEWLRPKRDFVGILTNSINLLFVYFLKMIGYTVSHHPAIAKSYAHYLNKQLLKKDYDFVLGFDSIYLGYLKTSCPILYRSDAVFHSMINYYIFNVPKSFIKSGDQVELKALENCAAMFAPSQWVIEEVAKWYPDIDINKIKYIPSGANIPYVESYHNKAEKEIINLLFIGSDPFRKGIDIAYDTIKILNEKYNKGAILTVIGGDIKQYADCPNVNYLGNLSKNNGKQADIFKKALEDADWFILPTHAECAGITNCEACAYGIPIIAYNTGGVASYVRDRVNGYCLNLSCTADDFAKSILNTNAKDYKLFSQKARQLYEEEFNWDCWRRKATYIIDNLKNDR